MSGGEDEQISFQKIEVMVYNINLKQERTLWQRTKKLVIGVDEAGRGALAGPVVCAAFLIKKINQKISRPPISVKDSKQLSPHQREILFEWLKKQPNFIWSVAQSSEKLIDKINIRQANFQAMQKAIRRLAEKYPQAKNAIILVDGKEKIPDLKQKQIALIKGDTKVFSIALASICAKVSRDRLMIKLAKKYPQYDLEIHKGYGTVCHFQKIKKHGLSKIHRKSFLGKLFN